jgi:flagellar motor switch protein FliN/FliY
VGSGAIDWQVPVTVNGAIDASMTVGLTTGTAQRLTAVVRGRETAHAEATVADTLQAIITQAATAVGGAHPTPLRFVVGVPVHDATTPPSTAWQHDLLMDDGDPPRLVVWRTSSATSDRDSTAALVDGPGAAPAANPHRNLDVVLDLELPITVRFGETRLTLDALARLGAGSVIDLERAPDDPVDLLVNGRLVARGEVVVVSGCYGVRVREVVSAADRLRSLEG